MIFTESELKGHFIAETEPFSDERGFFERLFCLKEFETIGIRPEITQINHSVSAKRGTFRGLHFQVPPYDEMKIIKCLRGSVLDIAVDIRSSSPTFLRWTAVEISAENNRLVIIPAGFAHGFQTLTDNAELIYLHTGFYNSEKESALNYLDPKLKISLPLRVSIISKRDSEHPFLNDPETDLSYYKK